MDLADMPTGLIVVCLPSGDMLDVVRLAIDGATLFMGLYLLAALWLTWRFRPGAGA